MTCAAGTPNWLDLSTHTPDQTQAFYSDLFGWTSQVDGPKTNHYARASQEEGSAVGVSPVPADAILTRTWTVYFASDNLAADGERVRMLGGQVMAGPHQVGDQGWFGVFADPTGAVFGLWQAGTFAGAEARDGEGSLAWVQVNTPDSARASVFHESLFHASSVGMQGMDYRQFLHGGQGFAGISGMMQKGSSAHWIPYFYARDVDAAVQRAIQGGGVALGETLDTPFGRMALLADPAGTSFWLMNPNPA